MIWNFGDFMTYFTGNQLWFYFSRVGSQMLPALMFHLISTIVSPEKKSSLWVVFAYFFSGLLALSSTLAMFDPRIQWFASSIFRNISFLVTLGPFLLAGIVMLFIAISRTKFEDEKSRLRYILAAALIAVPTGLSDLLQPFKIPVPPLGHLGCLVYSSVLAIGIFKHRTAYDILAQTRMKLEALSEMAAGIAHEIRNPLSSIKGASNLLADELKHLSHPKCQEYHTIITDEIERLNNILINFQDLTRPLKIEKQSVSINEIIKKTVKLTEIGTLSIKISQELSKDLPMIQADPAFLKQVFLNLIKNSAEACGSEGELVIKTESFSPWLKIIFSDNGPGIPDELLNRIFEPFFTTKATGIGMGLAICHRIIEAHNGRIEANNLLPKGTQFSILLFI
jgi:signal transduction histidine kinase